MNRSSTHAFLLCLLPDPQDTPGARRDFRLLALSLFLLWSYFLTFLRLAHADHDAIIHLTVIVELILSIGLSDLIIELDYIVWLYRYLIHQMLK